MKPISIIHADGISPAGWTVPDAMDTLYAARQNFMIPPHFNYKNLLLGVIENLLPKEGESRATALMKAICERLPKLPENTHLYVATTVGAIDVLENAKDDDVPDCAQITLDDAIRLTGCKHAVLVSAACASGQTAVAMASRALSLGQCEYALIIGIDISSRFVTSGFSSLRAYAKGIPHPYDAHRDGMLLGEGTGALLLTTQPHCNSLGTILAAHESCDASHITAPDVSGVSLANLINKTMAELNISPEDIGGIIGHGTGTLFNDASELAAINKTFPLPTPLISIKGITGHTLGATGVLQIVYGLEFLKRREMPPQAGLETPDDMAKPYLSKTSQPIRSNKLLTLNVGFGGINSTIVFTNNTVPTTSIPTTAASSFELISSATVSLKTNTAVYGDKSIDFENLVDLKQKITDVPEFVQGDLADFRRAADTVRLSQLAALLCASSVPNWSAENTALIGFNGDGCKHNNKAYWEDVVAHNYDNGRATLFVPTLPSIPVCETAITLGIKGPVRYLRTQSEEDVQRHLHNIFAFDASLKQIMTAEITQDTAVVRLYKR